MFDPRIYRAAMLPAVAAFVLLMFSLEPTPAALPAPVATPTFEGDAAARTARTIVELAPEREPGSPGDEDVGDLVRERFSAIEGGEVAVQDFEASHDGEDVTLRNVVLTLPGNSERTLLVIAHRDSDSGPGTASSAAATAELLTLAEALGRSDREGTLIFASTDGGSIGAIGARELVENLPRAEAIDAALVIAQPGPQDPRPPFVVASGLDPESPSPQLVRTARAATASRYGERDDEPGTWASLSRLAVPAGLGEQAVLRDEGLEALAISGAGERQLPVEDDTTVSAEAMAASGTAMMDLILTLDEAERPPAEGPAEYVRLGDNLIPGWTLSLLAIALIIPALLAAADTWLRELRADWRTRRTLPWAAERALIPLAGLLLVYALGLIGLLPDPGFPYDPAQFEPGAEAPIAFVAIAGSFALAALLIRPLRIPLDSEPHTLAAAAGLITGVAILALWLLNPYLALLLAPAAHVWLLPARASGPPRAAVVAGVAIATLLPAVAAFATVSGQLDLGLAAPWHLLLMIVGGQLGLLECLLWCATLGGLIACVSAATAFADRSRAAGGVVLGTGTHAGPGSLGATPSALRGR